MNAYIEDAPVMEHPQILEVPEDLERPGSPAIPYEDICRDNGLAVFSDWEKRL